MHFQALGTLAVLADGVALDVRPGRQRLLLACLLAHANSTVPFEVLTEALWPGDGTRRSVELRPVVSRLRRCVDVDHGRRGRLITRANGYELGVGSEEFDVFAFERCLERGRRAWADGRPAEARDLLKAALATWRGAAFTDFADSGLLQPEIARLAELREAAVEDLVDVELALGHESEVVATLVRLVADEPFRERRRSQLVLALYRAGRQAQALQEYRDYQRLLADELGLVPGPRLVELERRVLRHDPGLVRVAGAPEPEARARGRRLLEIGEGQRRTGGPYRSTLLEAGRVGLGAGDEDVVVEAALAGGRGTFSRLGEVDRERVRLIESALEVGRSVEVRARLLAHLAAELTFEPSRRRADAAAAEAMVWARLSHDPLVEVEVVLERLSSGLGDPEVQRERQVRVREVAGLVRDHGDPGHRFWLASVESVCAVERFDADALRLAQRRMADACEEVDQPMVSWFAATSGSWAALLDGDLGRARRLSERAAETGAETGQRDAWLIHQVQLFHLAWHSDRPEEMLEAAMRSASSTRTGDARIAWASALAGRSAAAGEMVERAYAAGFPSSARVERLTDLCAWAGAAVALDHRPAADRLTTLLGPWSGSVAVTGGVVYPCVAHHLGRLATVRGRSDEARSWLRTAMFRHRRLRAPFFLHETRLALAAAAHAVS